MSKILLSQDYGISVEITDTSDLKNIHIENSCSITDHDTISSIMNEIWQTPEYIALGNWGRSQKSQINEWIAHNVLYSLGYNQIEQKVLTLTIKKQNCDGSCIGYYRYYDSFIEDI